MSRKVNDIQADIKANRGLYISLQAINPCSTNKEYYMNRHLELERELNKVIREKNQSKAYFAIVDDKSLRVPPPTINNVKLEKVREAKRAMLQAQVLSILG